MSFHTYSQSQSLLSLESCSGHILVSESWETKAIVGGGLGLVPNRVAVAAEMAVFC